MGGECNPASGAEGQSEIGAAVAAAPRDTVGFRTALSDSSSDLGGGECAPSTTGTGLSEIGAAVTAAYRDSAAGTALSGDSATAAAASQDGSMDAAHCMIVLCLQQMQASLQHGQLLIDYGHQQLLVGQQWMTLHVIIFI